MPPFLSSGAWGSLKISRWSQPRSCSPSSSCCKPRWLRHLPTLRDPSPLSQGHWGKKNKDVGQKCHTRTTKSPRFTSSPHMNGAHCCSSTLYRIPACTVVAPSGRALPRGWDPTSAGGSMAKSRSSPLPERPKPLG